MGTKFVPVYATLTVGHPEEKVSEQIKAVFVNDYGNCFIKYWKRFLDDCFIPWTKSTKDLETLHNVLNNLSVGYLEEKIYEQTKACFGNDFGNCFIKYWKRFLDDCFIPWTKSTKDLETLQNVLNNLHKDIIFTLQFSNAEQSFLDVYVENREGKMETDIFYKEKDIKKCLSRLMTKPTKWHVRPSKTQISLGIRGSFIILLLSP